MLGDCLTNFGTFGSQNCGHANLEDLCNQSDIADCILSI